MPDVRLWWPMSVWSRRPVDAHQTYLLLLLKNNVKINYHNIRIEWAAHDCFAIKLQWVDALLMALEREQ